MMLNLSFYRRTEFIRRPLAIKDAKDIRHHKAKGYANLPAIIFFAGLIVWLVLR